MERHRSNLTARGNKCGNGRGRTARYAPSLDSTDWQQYSHV